MSRTSMSDMQGTGKHVALTHIEGGSSHGGKHRGAPKEASMVAAAPPASRTAEFHSGIHGAGFGQYPRLGDEALDKTYKGGS